MMITDLGLLLGVTLLCAVLPVDVHGAVPPAGAMVIECRDRYFWVSLDTAFAGSKYRFDIANGATVRRIIDPLASECGFTYSNNSVTGRLIFRASYFACYVHNELDSVFTLTSNFVKIDPSGGETTFPLSKTCTLSIPWNAREVICEENYMEVSVRRTVPQISQTQIISQEWDITYSIAQRAALATWQVVFLKTGLAPTTMNTSYAWSQGYVMGSTPGRVVFRSPYGQPLSELVMVNGIQVETIHATIFYRQKWMLVLIDMSTACTTNPGSFDGTNLLWSTPIVLRPLVQVPTGFVSSSIRMGVEGLLLDNATMLQKGYGMSVGPTLVEIQIPFGADGGSREVHVIDNQYSERYIINLYYEHIFADGSQELTRHRMARLVHTPYLPQTPFTINQTILAERVFTVYLGVFNPDVALIAVDLNGVPLTVPQAQLRGFTISTVQHPNGTHAYVLKVPFEDPIVLKSYSGPTTMMYVLNINYTLNIVPQNEPYYHPATVAAQIRIPINQDLTAVCKEKSILFSITQMEMSYLWEICIGSDPLTPELAANRGYILKNTTQGLTLEVPLYTIGYTYEDIGLNMFFGIFTLSIRDASTLSVVAVSTKRCPFNSEELVVCMPNGTMTVVASVASTVPMVDPLRTTLLDRSCKPNETNATAVLFTFSVTTCGTRFMVDDHYLMYENEVVFNGVFLPESAPVITRDSEYRLTVRCYYPVNDTQMLALDWVPVPAPRSAGIGSLIQAYPSKGLKRSRAVPSTHNGIMRGKGANKEAVASPLQDEEGLESPSVPALGVAIVFLGVFLLASILFVKTRC
nr:PREDICTED: uncharacterized protein LOC107076608 [Lepisosteus oculatus]